MIIVTAKSILEAWCEDLPTGYYLANSDTGYTNDRLSLDWLIHFDNQTSKRLVGKWRLLIMDGYGSHLTKEFIEYAESKFIKLWSLPPHTSHFLQPLDVACFSPFKWYHSRMIDLATRTGSREFRKVDFLAILHEIRTKAFRPDTIKSGFRQTGISPLNAKIVVDQLRLKEQAKGGSINSVPDIEPRRLDTSLDPQLLNERPSTPLDNLASSSSWDTPSTIRTLQRHTTRLIQDSMQDIATNLAAKISRTLKGAYIQAHTGALSAELLQQTESAQTARHIRHNRRRRKVSKGGPVYAEQARRITQQKQEQEEIALRTKLTLITKRDTEKWRKRLKRDVFPKLRKLKYYGGKLSRERSQRMIVADTSTLIGFRYTANQLGYQIGLGKQQDMRKWQHESVKDYLQDKHERQRQAEIDTWRPPPRSPSLVYMLSDMSEESSLEDSD